MAMELSNETVRKIRGLIVFTALITACLWKYDVVVKALAFVFHILLPFVLGGAIAFVLNVPMNFVQRNLFNEDKIKGKKRMQKLAGKRQKLYEEDGASGQYADCNLWSDWDCGYCDVCAHTAAWHYICQSGCEHPGIYSKGAGMG